MVREGIGWDPFAGANEYYKCYTTMPSELITEHLVWIDVQRTNPECDRDVLVACDDGRVRIAQLVSSGEGYPRWGVLPAGDGSVYYFDEQKPPINVVFWTPMPRCPVSR